MFFDNADIELLRLIGWCKNLPTGQEKVFDTSLLSIAGISALQSVGYLTTTSNDSFHRLKPQGQELLKSLGYDYPADSKYVSVDKTITRRKEAAGIMLTFYRAGYDIFSDQLSALEIPCSYLSAMALRRNEDKPCNIFGGARFAGIGRSYSSAYLCYYVDGGKIYHTNERRFFMNAIDKTQCTPAAIYFGKSYKQVADIITQKTDETSKNKSNQLAFYEAYRKSTIPIHIVECSDIGASQLLIMGQENYRFRMARLALGELFTPPYQGISGGDAIFNDGTHLPVVIGIDMDIKHIRSVYRAARERDFETIAVVGFKEQLPTLASLCSNMKPALYGIDRTEVLLAFDLKLYEPPNAPYITQEGGYINASLIKKT